MPPLIADLKRRLGAFVPGVSWIWFALAACAAAFSLGTYAVEQRNAFRLENAVVKVGDRPTERIALPHQDVGLVGDVVIYEADFYLGGYSTSEVRILPDDYCSRILVNGKSVNLSQWSDGQRSDYTHGFILDLKPYAKEGKNRISVWLQNRGNPFGLNIHQANDSRLGRLSRTYGSASAFLFVCGLWHALNRLGSSAASGVNRPVGPRGRSLRVGVTLACLALAIFLYQSSIFRPVEVLQYTSESVATPVGLPHSGELKAGRAYTYSGSFQVTPVFNPKITIRPDDLLQSIQINGIVVELSAVPRGARHFFHGGFDVDIGQYVKPGINTFDAEVVNVGGPGGLSIVSSRKSAHFFVGWSVVVVACLFLIGEIVAWLGLPRVVSVLFLVAAGLRLAYFGYTSPWDRANDVGGHVDHLAYIVDQRALPAEAACWECQHPSTYYIGGALAHVIADALGVSDPLAGVQCLSLILDLVYLAAAAKIFLWLIPKQAHIACALLFFWPAGVIQSVAINNDIPFYSFVVLAACLAIRWSKTQRYRDAALCLLCAGLASAVKTNGLIAIPAVVAYGFIVLFRTRKLREAGWKYCVLAILVLAPIFTFLWVHRYAQRVDRNMASQLVPNHVGLNGRLIVGNEARNYYLFDLVDFIEEPYTDNWSDKGGRQYFTNYFLKSSLFGEYPVFGPFPSLEVAHGMKIMLFPIMFGGAIGLLLLGRIPLPERWLMLILFAGPLLGVLLLRYKIPYSCSAHFRYATPMLVPALVFASLGLDWVSNRLPLGRLRWANLLSSFWMVMGCVYILVYYAG